MSDTGDKRYAADQAGYSNAKVQGSQLINKPAIQAQVIQYQACRIVEAGLPAAIDCLIGLVTNDKAPAGARVQAAKIILDRSFGGDTGAAAKELHEMTPDELQQAIDRLRKEAADRAKPVIEAEPQEGNIFE
jgi:phage terminase small subunit